MNKITRNLQTGEITETPLTAAEIAKREAYERDVLPVRLREKAEADRAAAYAAEADPLFFQAQRGEATMDEWTAKVAEIRTRYPYPGDAE
jgi:hypothetical protein